MARSLSSLHIMGTELKSSLTASSLGLSLRYVQSTLSQLSGITSSAIVFDF